MGKDARKELENSFSEKAIIRQIKCRNTLLPIDSKKNRERLGAQQVGCGVSFASRSAPRSRATAATSHPSLPRLPSPEGFSPQSDAVLTCSDRRLLRQDRQQTVSPCLRRVQCAQILAQASVSCGRRPAIASCPTGQITAPAQMPTGLRVEPIRVTIAGLEKLHTGGPRVSGIPLEIEERQFRRANLVV